MHFAGPWPPTYTLILTLFFLDQTHQAHNCWIVIFVFLRNFPSHHHCVTLYVPVTTLRKGRGEGTPGSAISRLCLHSLPFTKYSPAVKRHELYEVYLKLEERKGSIFYRSPTCLLISLGHLGVQEGYLSPNLFFLIASASSLSIHKNC